MAIYKYIFILLFGTSIISCSPKQLTNNTEQGFLGNYSLIDKEYGTKTVVTLEGKNRIIETNALPNHKTGEFPNQGNPNTIQAQKNSYKIPIEPKFLGKANRVRQTGVALNGVKFEPGTAEQMNCESGEHYRIEAIQDLTDLGLDFNNAHVQPTGAYHYHGISTLLLNAFDNGDDIVHLGYALDGYKILYSKSSTFKSSYKLSTVPRKGAGCTYRNPTNAIDLHLKGTTPDGTYTSDWKYMQGLGDLDECNGMKVDGEYAYFITEEFPYISRCLKGEFEQERRGGGPPPAGRRRGGPPPHNN